MMHECPVAVSVLIATKNRESALRRMLDTLTAALAVVGDRAEVIVADNGSTDDTPLLLERWCADGPRRRWHRVGETGKSIALNRSIPLTSAPLLAFTDDDVEVPREWLHRLIAFFADHPQYAAAMGRVLLPPEVTDPDLFRAARCYGTLPVFDGGSEVKDIPDLYGCNMVVRRDVLDRVGGFNEQIGPGATGLYEDVDLANRIREAGFRIGYMPDTVMYHTLDRSRLTARHAITHQFRNARSRFLTNPNCVSWRNATALTEATLVFLVSVCLRRDTQRIRALRRMATHVGLLHAWWRHRGSRSPLRSCPGPAHE